MIGYSDHILLIYYYNETLSTISGLWSYYILLSNSNMRTGSYPFLDGFGSFCLLVLTELASLRIDLFC